MDSCLLLEAKPARPVVTVLVAGPDGEASQALRTTLTQNGVQQILRAGSAAAVRDLYRHRWQYSHFSALWEMTSNHGRLIFCDQCDGITAASAGVCSGCGTSLADVHR